MSATGCPALGLLGLGAARQRCQPWHWRWCPPAGQSWAGARPRGLQWTWLGRAELRFGDCVLHVSTLQMFVLLRFNGAEVGAGAKWGRASLPGVSGH